VLTAPGLGQQGPLAHLDRDHIETLLARECPGKSAEVAARTVVGSAGGMMLCTKVDQDNFDYKQNTVPLQSLTGNMVCILSFSFSLPLSLSLKLTCLHPSAVSQPAREKSQPNVQR
jgi:hypothetical protein